MPLPPFAQTRMRFDRRLLTRSLAVLALTALPLACGDDDTTAPTPAASVIESTTFASSLGVDLARSTQTASGLYYRDLTVGTGAVVSAGQRLFIRYTGSLANGTQFDATAPGDPPFDFVFGVGEVIAGWDQGIAGMRVGGRRQLIIPPALGYGAGGRGPIPGNAVLVFTVEVVAAR